MRWSNELRGRKSRQSELPTAVGTPDAQDRKTPKTRHEREREKRGKHLRERRASRDEERTKDEEPVTPAAHGDNTRTAVHGSSTDGPHRRQSAGQRRRGALADGGSGESEEIWGRRRREEGEKLTAGGGEDCGHGGKRLRSRGVKLESKQVCRTRWICVGTSGLCWNFRRWPGLPTPARTPG